MVPYCIFVTHLWCRMSKNLTTIHVNLVSARLTMNSIVASIYRPPTASFSSFSKVMSHMQDYLDASNNDQKSVYVTGDFNLPNMNWGQLSFRQILGTNNNQACELLLNFMGKNFLNQVVDKSTRNKNTLDIVLTNNVINILSVSSDPTSVSDHNIVGLHCLQNHQPHSSTIPYLQEQLGLLQLSIRDSITEELSKR